MNALRKRELLLSLKYGTVESCFSVPMLNLTLANFPFVIGFAVKVLGWSDAAIGLLAATPFLCFFLQPPLTYLLQRFFSLYQIMVLGFVGNALPWMLVVFFPWMGPHRDWGFAAIVMISTLANAVCAVSWSASMSELVPLAIRGKYFGTRNMIFGFWTLVVVLTAGKLADAYANSLTVFGIIFLVAAVARLFGLFFLTRMRFPALVLARRPQAPGLGLFAAVFRDGNFTRLLLFTGLFGLCLNLAVPFYSVYVLKELPLTLGDLAVLTTLSTFGSLVSLRTWGALSDRFGNKPIMVTSALLWLVLAAVSWLFSGAGHYRHLYLTYFITGFMTAGFQQIGQFNLMIKMVPAENRTHYISVYFSFTNMLIALGPIIGGAILQRLPADAGNLFGQPLNRYHILIVGSLLLCVLMLHLLQTVREPAERSVRELVKVMANMREFNPLLGLSTLAQFMFTPRGLSRFAHASVRTLRRQTSAVAEVGEELVEGGWRALREPFRKGGKE